MDKQDIDPKKILILAVLLFLMFTGYQLYIFYFATPSQQTQRTTQTKAREEAPALLLGSSRQAQKPQNIQTFDFENFRLSVAQEGGRIVSLIDKKYDKELITQVEKELGIYPLEVFSGNPELDSRLNFATYQISREGNTVIIKEESSGVEKRLTYKGNHFELSISSPYPLYVSAGTHVKEDAFYTHEGPVFKLGASVQRPDIKDIEARELVQGDIRFAGEESRYYFKGFSGEIQSVVIYRLDEKHTLTLVKTQKPLVFYAGAKEYTRLKGIGLEDVIDYGTLRLLVKPLFVFMYWIYEHLGSWVFSIIALTLIVRLLVFPLTYKSTVAMARLAEIAPKVQQLKEKYKDDPAKMQEEMIRLYSEVGFNPMSGCLPILLQIPVFFALYKVLTITADLQLASLLWIPSLSQKDPYYILPILMGLTMIAQQFITPNPDRTQNMMMYVSSIAFTFLFASFPAGLVLYWTFNNILSIGQNYLIKKVILKDKVQQPRQKERKKKR